MALAVSVTVVAQGSGQAPDTRRKSARWPPADPGTGTSGVAGIRTTTVSGDPSSAGLYTIRLSVPANTRIEAHTHRDVRSATVVSGTWYLGYGRATVSPPQSLTPGSFCTENRPGRGPLRADRGGAVEWSTSPGTSRAIRSTPARSSRPSRGCRRDTPARMRWICSTPSVSAAGPGWRM